MDATRYFVKTKKLVKRSQSRPVSYTHLDVYKRQAREYLKTQHLEAEYECRTAHKVIKRGAANYNEYEQGYEEEEQ